VSSLAIRAFKDNQEYHLNANKSITIRVIDPAPMQMMKLFYGEMNLPLPLPLGTNQLFTWQQSNDSTSIRTFIRVDSSTNNIIRGYDINSKRLKWISCARFMDVGQPKTKVTAILPPNFTNLNTNVFLVFRDHKSVIMMNPEFISRTFNTHNIPIGANAKLVAISRRGTESFLVIKDITVSANMNERLIPQVKSPAEIIHLLEGL
jgi:hypothetical protein